MAQSLIACPLCSAASFSSTSSLCLSLVTVASKWLRCTLCDEELRGLDKLTIHLLSHLIHSPDFKRLICNENSPPSHTKTSFNCQPLNLIKSQNEQMGQEQEVAQESVCDALRSFPTQSEDMIERPSLKIDDQVMIFFNCEKPNKEPGSNISEVSLTKDSSSGAPSSDLPKFVIDFNKSVHLPNQNNNISGTEQTKIISNNSCFGMNSGDQIPHYFFPVQSIKESSANENDLGSLKTSNSQMDLSTDDKEKEVCTSNCLGEIDNISNTIMEKDNSYSDIEKQSCHKSSFLSPKGERVLGFRCDICSLVFPDENILSMHRQLIHVELHGSPSEPTSYKCHLCSKSFVMKGSLMVHMRVAHFGGAVVARLVEAKQLETDAVSPDSAQFVCSICNKGFRKEQQWAQHEKLHDGKQCDICLKTFTTKYFLRKHKRLHTGEMPYQCRECNKSFTFQQSYHKHLLYHSDDKPYSCGECGRAFKELSTLHNHQRIHTGEKPFSCESCGKCFRQRVSYLVHRRIHTGVMPYRCQDCGKTFRYKVSERTHKCSVSTPGVSCETPNPPATETNQEDVSPFVSKVKTEEQRNNESNGLANQGLNLEAQVHQMQVQDELNQTYPEPPDFFSMVMSPSDRLQHLSLTSEPSEETSSRLQHESIDTEALQQLLYDVADYT